MPLVGLRAPQRASCLSEGSMPLRLHHNLYKIYLYFKIASSKSLRILDLFGSNIKVVVEKNLSTSVNVAATCKVKLKKLARNKTSSLMLFFIPMSESNSNMSRFGSGSSRIPTFHPDIVNPSHV